MSSSQLFQYSVVSALMDGVAETGIAISDLVSHGNHGLGTFRHIVGEMIILDGTIYQMNLDGSVVALDSAACVEQSAPFAMITHFQPTTMTTRLLESKGAFADALSQLLPGTKNHYLAFRVDGVFKSVTVRTVGGQQFPGESLARLGKRQVSHTFKNIRGTVIGFRSPTFMQGVSVAGDHLHFIAANRDSGGHVLTFKTDGEVDIAAAPITVVNLRLPSNDADFNRAELASDDNEIAAVEG
ncbi:alpha-acetolactate decarboxylase [Dactylonectria macrodidyma]|uniref:Alpha-acetolactate decarboxylase n=1 Tax=Dactylonectria macrodidyma TaxID=307937 RepID=A0A9P9DS26_9HYPO|nr:alpha-acetolactate decarboxylase [Dactylonectria macrodidyma]